MRQVFADTYYWITLLNDKDQGHPAAQAAGQSLGQATMVTTQEVLYQAPLRLAIRAFVGRVNKPVEASKHFTLISLSGFVTSKAPGYRPGSGHDAGSKRNAVRAAQILLTH
jgi:hypothetical protein